MPDLAYYQKRLRVNKHALDDELEVQAQFQDEIGRAVAAANAHQLAAKDHLDRVTARVVVGLKSEKMSDIAAAGAAKNDEDRIEAWQDYQAAREEWERWTTLYEAWQQKGWSIKTLAGLYEAQYFSITNVSSAGSGHSVERSIEEGRAALARTRRRIGG